VPEHAPKWLSRLLHHPLTHTSSKKSP
jgi:hypothetical protein